MSKYEVVVVADEFVVSCAIVSRQMEARCDELVYPAPVKNDLVVEEGHTQLVEGGANPYEANEGIAVGRRVEVTEDDRP